MCLNSEKQANLVDGSTDYPGDDGGVDGCEGCPTPRTCLVLDGDDGGDAGEIQQDEQQVAIGRKGRDTLCQHQLPKVRVFLVIITERVIIGK